jgi:hypothetical protein
LGLLSIESITILILTFKSTDRYKIYGEIKMLGEKAGSMTFKETSKAIPSGKYGLPAMETSTVGGGKMLGHDVMAQATFSAEMRPDGSWLGDCPAGIMFCAEGVATYICSGVGNMTAAGGVSFRGGASFETTSEALSELNGKYYMFTYESDPEGNAEWNLYPCK